MIDPPKILRHPRLRLNRAFQLGSSSLRVKQTNDFTRWKCLQKFIISKIRLPWRTTPETTSRQKTIPLWQRRSINVTSMGWNRYHNVFERKKVLLMLGFKNSKLNEKSNIPKPRRTPMGNNGCHRQLDDLRRWEGNRN